MAVIASMYSTPEAVYVKEKLVGMNASHIFGSYIDVRPLVQTAFQ